HLQHLLRRTAARRSRRRHRGKSLRDSGPQSGGQPAGSEPAPAGCRAVECKRPSGTKKGTQTSLFAPLGVEMSCLIRILVAASVWGVSVGLMRLISVAISRENQPLSMFVMSFVIGGIYAGRITTEVWQDPPPRRAQRMWMLLTALGALFGFVFDLFCGLTEI